MKIFPAIPAVAAFAALAACQPAASTGNEVGPSVSAEGSAALPTLPNGEMRMPVEPDGGIGDTPGTVRPEPAGPLLQPMTYGEFSPVVASGMGCSFSADDKILFVATAPDDRRARAQGAIKYGGTVGTVNATKTGGFRTLREGGIFAGSDITLNIGRGAGEGVRDGDESTKWPATLTVTELSVGDRSYEGYWSCGA
jgi:hypothetical protein